jgi:hypothetical protein
MSNQIEYRPGVDTNLRVYVRNIQIGLIMEMMGEWCFLGDCKYYRSEHLRGIARKLDELNATERARTGDSGAKGGA